MAGVHRRGAQQGQTGKPVAAEEEEWRRLARTRPGLRGVSHLTAAVVSVFTGWALVMHATGSDKLPALIYGIATFCLYLASGMLHYPTWPPATRLKLRKLDHSMIYLEIAATYNLSWAFPEPPYFLLVVGWGTLVLGVLSKLFLWEAVQRSRHAKIITVAPFLIAGWACALEIRNLGVYLPYLGYDGLFLLAVGGICYSLGGICYAKRNFNPHPDFGYHEVLHMFVIAANACFYCAAWLLLGRTAALA